MKRRNFRSRTPLALVLLAVPVVVVGQTDEIQVYDAEIAEPGVFNLMIHTNYIPIGRKTPDFPGTIIADHSVNGAAEWAYGVTDWFEQGLYLPVWSPNAPDRGLAIGELLHWLQIVEWSGQKPALAKDLDARVVIQSQSTT